MGVMPRYLPLAFAAVLVGLVLRSAPAYAHAALVSTDPVDGARQAMAPRSVTLTFNENVATPAFVVVTAPDGTRVATGKVSILDHTVKATVAAIDMKGIYTLSYRVVSGDSHAVEGTTTFTITTGRTVKQVAPVEESFAHRHRNHLIWGLVGAAAAVGLLIWPLRGKHDAEDK